MNTNKNKKLALRVLNSKSFELNNRDYECLTEILKENLNKKHFICVLTRFRCGKYHINGRLSK